MKNILRKKALACEICGNAEFAPVSSRIREGEGRIVRCRLCGLVMQDLGWDDDRIRGYYEGEYQRTNSLARGRVQTPQEHFEDRSKTIGPLFERIQPFLRPGGKVLDVGCGAGSLLRLIRPHVARCVGAELHTPFVDFINGSLSMEAHAGDINKLDLKDKFDLIICIATLDHMPNPLESLRTMRGLLSPGGMIYIEVPNRDEALNHFIPAAARRKYNEFFWHRAHLFYFTGDTIAALFGKAGLKAEVSCRHEYTLKNFLNWYFLGEPQAGFVAGVRDADLFEGASDFEARMNRVFRDAEGRFKEIMSDTFGGDSLCCTGRL